MLVQIKKHKKYSPFIARSLIKSDYIFKEDIKHVDETMNETINECQKEKKYEVKELYKEDYDNIVFIKRREFMMKYFSKDLKNAFEELEEQANKMKKCEHTISFSVEDHFDSKKIEIIIIDYFIDLGYKPTIVQLAPGCIDVCLCLS